MAKCRENDLCEREREEATTSSNILSDVVIRRLHTFTQPKESLMMQPSNEFKESSKKSLDAVSAGVFFQANLPRLLPSFDQWNANEKGKCVD